MKQSKFQLLTCGVGLLMAFLPKSSFADSAKVIRLSEGNIAHILISDNGTVLSFPAKPSKVILGRRGSFGIDYIENDLAISPLNPEARSDLFVYVLGRRFSFELIATAHTVSPVIEVSDKIDSRTKKK